MDDPGRQRLHPDRAIAQERDREALIEGEVQHRLRNLIAVVRSIFSRTVENATSMEDMADHFRGRLDALGRYQTGLSAGSTYDLETMIWDELMVYAVRDDLRVDVAGPTIGLSEHIARPLGMALHELITNSIKYGVLSSTGNTGKLAIGWDVDRDLLTLRWQETEVPIVSPKPIRAGFGRQYIEQALPYELGATTRFALVPGGVECTIAVPLASRVRQIDAARRND